MSEAEDANALFQRGLAKDKIPGGIGIQILHGDGRGAKCTCRQIAVRIVVDGGSLALRRLSANDNGSPLASWKLPVFQEK
jgi:hypothetical protein